MSQIRDKKAHRKRIATMNPINTKACNSLSCTLLLIVYYLFPYRNHLTISKAGSRNMSRSTAVMNFMPKIAFSPLWIEK